MVAFLRVRAFGDVFLTMMTFDLCDGFLLTVMTCYDDLFMMTFDVAFGMAMTLVMVIWMTMTFDAAF